MTSTRAGHALGAQVPFHEFHHLAAALADQGDDVDVGPGIAGHHAHERGFAHAGTGHNAHALSLAQGQQAVDGAHAHVQNVRNARTLQRAGRVGVNGGQLGMPLGSGLYGPFRRERGLDFQLALKVGLAPIPGGQGRGVDFRAHGRPGVQGRAEGVKSPAQQLRPHGKNRRQAGIADEAARPDAAHVPVGHEQQIAVTEAHHFGGDALAFPVGEHMADRAQGGAQSAALGHQANHLVDLAEQPDGIAGAQQLGTGARVQFHDVLTPDPPLEQFKC